MWVSTCCRVRHEAAEALGAIGNGKCECMLRQFEDDDVLEVSGLASTGAAPMCRSMRDRIPMQRARCRSAAGEL